MPLRNTIAFLTGITTTLTIAEITLGLLPVTQGVAAADYNKSWPARHLVPKSSYTSSSGWALENVQHGAINNKGYIAPFDYIPGAKAGIIIGDSYVEGMMNPYSSMLQAQLADRLNIARNKIYNFGTAGASLPHYLGVARLAGTQYQPEWAVILITARDFKEGFQSSPGMYKWSRSSNLIDLPPARHQQLWQNILANMGLVRYSRINLKVTTDTFTKSGFELPPQPSCQQSGISHEDRKLVTGWVHEIPRALNLAPARIVLLFDADRPSIYADKPTDLRCQTRDNIAQQELRSIAQKAEFKIVNMDVIFRADWKKHQRAFDRSPLDAHWSPYAHSLAAYAVAHALQTSDTSPR